MSFSGLGDQQDVTVTLNFQEYLAIAKGLDIGDKDFVREAAALKMIASDLRSKGQLPGTPDDFNVSGQKYQYSIIDPATDRILYKIQ